ncbi:hypothetical protein [Hymenobacter persicinus]|uniref:YcxB family protein n=1 Tax=Hymenobacter persicinus TaxID=2025506 RepID=A0A4Q5L9U2_9BACT|nr:hypothetical protein [Hymenobacter persicinus]RYU77209.1 hypothetical protein EWM57_17730 [Hymenobacter persicinus]
MSYQVITRAERINLFLKEYYFGNSTWTNSVRIVGGPLVIGCGVYLYPSSLHFAVGYGGFCLVYGIYYLLKPAVIILVRPALFQTAEFDLHLDTEVLTVQERGVKVTVRYDSFKSIRQQSEYYAVKLPEKMTIHFRKSQLTEQEQATLNQHLTA